MTVIILRDVEQASAQLSEDTGKIVAIYGETTFNLRRTAISRKKPLRIGAAFWIS